MALTFEQEEKLERYAAGLMNTDEEKIFLSEVQSVKELQDALDLELALRDNFEYIDIPASPETGDEKVSPFDDPVNLKSLVDRVGKEWNERNERDNKSEIAVAPIIPIAHRGNPPISINFWSTIAVAACLIIAISLIVTKFSNSPSSQVANKPKDPVPIKKDSLVKINNDSQKIIVPTEIQVDYTKLYKSSYRKDKLPEELPQIMESELLAYEEGKYQELENFNLEELPTTRRDENPSNNPQYIREIGHYYKGIAFIETGNDRKAETNFSWVLNKSKNKSFIGKASWYLALLKIKHGTKADAVKLLQDVLSNSSAWEYHDRAHKLLTELK